VASDLDLLQSLQPDLDRCNKCGFCMAGCPTYRAGGQMEWLVTRGRVSLLQDALSGAIPLAETAPAIDTCLLCNACMEHCPPQVPITHLVTTARSAMRAAKPLPASARFVLRNLLPSPRLLRLVAKVGGAGEKLGLRKAAAPLLKRWPVLDRANQTGPKLTGVTARDLLRGEPLKPADGQVRARVAYFISCTKEIAQPRAALAAVRVLVAAGCEVLLPDVGCCGLPSHSAGDLEHTRERGEHLQHTLGALNVDAIVADDGSCTHHMNEYLPVKDFGTFVAELGLPEPKARVEKRVTWHDPCSLKHGMHIWAVPRRLIRAIPGVEYVEAADADMCCGGAGAFMLTQPELSDKVLAIKAAAFRATGAELVVTSSPSCLIQLGRELPVITLAELLEMAYCPQTK
jgi:glycolate oxidase iron-sulfur subunit